MQLNITNSSYYYFLKTQNSEILQVRNVSDEVLGSYKVMMSGEGINRSDTVTLVLAGMFYIISSEMHS